MVTWYKEGVIGDLNPGIRRGKRQIEKFFAERGEDLFITSKRDGNHGPGSCHPEGDAIDFRYPKLWHNLMEDKLRSQVGIGYDLVFHDSHIHLEYDPKK